MDLVNQFIPGVKPKTGIEYIIQMRAGEKDWYMVQYDTDKDKHTNNIIFMTYADAKALYDATEPDNENERILLMFSPQASDIEFEGNLLIEAKSFDGE